MVRLTLSKVANAARARAKWAAMTDEEKAAYYVERRKKPSRGRTVRYEGRVKEYREKLGSSWVPMSERPFCGVDGEGGEWEGRHCYGMLTVGENTLQNPDGSPLTTIQCLDFLTAQPKTRRYVIYFGGYDATLILRDMPVEVQQQIMDGAVDHQGRRTFVWWEHWGVDYIPRKILKIVRKKTHPDGPGSITLFDVSAYWQCSFLTALKDWEVGTEEEWEQIRVGKEARRIFTLPCSPDVLSYNLLECRLLADLCTKMVDATKVLEITLRSYHGPATLSTALFEKYGIERYVAKAPPEVDDLLRYAYFGGRFECSAVGIAPEVWEYDIASAYPAAMSTLPCQACGIWVEGEVNDVQSSIHHVSWAVPEGTRFGPFPWRSPQGNLCYPMEGQGYYWGEEVEAAQRAFGDGVRVLKSWSYYTACTHQPFEWMTELYAERQKLGKTTAGRVLKLAMNSAYGVLARTIGGGGKYSNYWWAGQITARTRARLLDLAVQAGEDCLMLATDAVYSSRPLPILTGTCLGAWEDGGTVGPMLLVQPGVYFSLVPDGKKYRTRGVSLRDINKTDGVRRLKEAWLEEGPEAVVPMNVNFLLGGEEEPTVFIGTRLALAWGKPELIGSWQPLDKSLSFRPEPRRRRGEWEGDLLRTWPPHHPFASIGVMSSPYKKMPGRNVETEAIRYDQPELF